MLLVSGLFMLLQTGAVEDGGPVADVEVEVSKAQPVRALADGELSLVASVTDLPVSAAPTDPPTSTQRSHRGQQRRDAALPTLDRPSWRAGAGLEVNVGA